MIKRLKCIFWPHTCRVDMKPISKTDWWFGEDDELPALMGGIVKCIHCNKSIRILTTPIFIEDVVNNASTL